MSSAGNFSNFMSSLDQEARSKLLIFAHHQIQLSHIEQQILEGSATPGWQCCTTVNSWLNRPVYRRRFTHFGVGQMWTLLWLTTTCLPFWLLASACTLRINEIQWNSVVREVRGSAANSSAQAFLLIALRSRSPRLGTTQWRQEQVSLAQETYYPYCVSPSYWIDLSQNTFTSWSCLLNLSSSLEGFSPLVQNLRISGSLSDLLKQVTRFCLVLEAPKPTGTASCLGNFYSHMLFTCSWNFVEFFGPAWHQIPALVKENTLQTHPI